MNHKPVIPSPDFSGSPVEFRFGDLFSLEEIQRLQDLFSDATGVASIILHPDGEPLTRPSNFCRLYRDIILQTEKGLADYQYLNQLPDSPGQPQAGKQPFEAAGLHSYTAGINAGGVNIANWIIGQVRNEEPDEEQIRRYAAEIGTDSSDFMKAWLEVPVMPEQRFEKVAGMLSAFAGELSEKASHNRLKKTRNYRMTDQDPSLKMRVENLKTILNSIGDGVVSIDNDGLLTWLNPVAEELC